MKISMSASYPTSVLPSGKRHVSAFQAPAPLRQSTQSPSPPSVRFGALRQMIGFFGQATKGVAMSAGCGYCAVKGEMRNMQSLPADVVAGLPMAMPTIAGGGAFINGAKAVKKKLSVKG